MIIKRYIFSFVIILLVYNLVLGQEPISFNSVDNTSLEQHWSKNELPLISKLLDSSPPLSNSVFKEDTSYIHIKSTYREFITKTYGASDKNKFIDQHKNTFIFSSEDECSIFLDLKNSETLRLKNGIMIHTYSGYYKSNMYSKVYFDISVFENLCTESKDYFVKTLKKEEY